ncbi:MAG: MFS transporter [Microgenomates group bacterium]
MFKTNYKKNIKYFLWTSIFQWFAVFIGVWVLIWRNYLSWEEIALVTSISLFVQLLLELPSGALADLWGRKNTVIFGRVLGVIGFTIFIFATNFWMFLIGNILYLANWAFESGALDALLFDSMKENGVGEEDYQKVQADTFFWCTIGMAISSTLGGYLYTLHHQLPYIATTLVSVGALISSFGLEEPELDSVKVNLKVYLRQNWEGFLHIFRNNKIRAISLFSILINFVAYVGLWYLYEPRLAEGGFPATWLALLVSGTYLIRAFGTKLIPLVLKFGDKNIPIILTLFQALGSALSFIESKFGAVSSVYLRKMSDGMRNPILARLQNVELESRYRATSLSAISLLGNILISLAGPLIGYLMEHGGASKTLGYSAAIGIILVLPSAIFLSREISKETN